MNRSSTPLHRILLLIAAALTTPLAASAAVLAVANGDSTGLQNAISSAADGDVVELAAGGFYAAPVGGFEIVNPNKRFTLRAANGVAATLDGGGTRAVLRYSVDNITLRGEVLFQDLIFQNGVSTTNGISGGLTIVRGRASCERCEFRDNRTDPTNTGGGGTAVFNSTVFFLDCLWQGNTSLNEGGGLKVGDDPEDGEGTFAFVHRSRFVDNRVNLPGHRNSSAGGGLHVGNAFVEVSNTRFEGNQAGYVGGAIFAIGSWTPPYTQRRAEVWISNSTFDGNLADTANGVIPPSPPVGGAIHGENQVTIHAYHSRFVGNNAELGGGFNLFRSIGEIENSVFQGNFVTGLGAGNGTGGAIGMSSNDGPGDGAENRPSAELAVRDSFIEGIDGQTVAQVGGGLMATGDTWRQYGLGGTTQINDLTANRTVVSFDNVIFANTDVLESSGVVGTGAGGGVDVTLTDLTLTDALFVGCDAVETSDAGDTSPDPTGGALRAITASLVDLNGTDFYGNSSDFRGGAVALNGVTAMVDSCIFSGNSTGALGSFDHLGAALYTVPVRIAFGTSFVLDGVVSNSTFVDNAGIAAYDGDFHDGPINDLRYNGNTFWNSHPSFGSDIYWNGLIGARNTGELNALTIVRNQEVDTDKSQVNNSFPGSEPSLGTLLRAPTKILNVVAAGDLASSTESYLGYGWNGSSATLDGGPVGSGPGWLSTGVGTHTLNVDGQIRTATVAAGPTPAASLGANPIAISSGQSATLTWSTNAGTFVAAQLDFRGAVAASGSQIVSPTKTTTYFLHVLTKEGGAIARATVYVDEVPPTLLFSDGFESGGTDAWSMVTP